MVRTASKDAEGCETQGFVQAGAYRVRVHPKFAEAALFATAGSLREFIEALKNPEAENILQDGRHRTYIRELKGILSGDDPANAGMKLAVKSFGRQSLAEDLISRARGGKATRSYGAAAFLHSKGVATPAPVAVVERWSSGRLLESYLVTVYEDGLVSFKDALIRLYRSSGPCSKLMALLETVAEFIARMHDAGFAHMDLGNQNLMLSEAGDGSYSGAIVLDLNRGRIRGGSLAIRERARDISRIHLPSDFRRVFLEMYWRGEVPPGDFLKRERFYRGRYAIHANTRHLRHPLRPRPVYDPETDYPPDSELWIWDERSVQAIPPFRSSDRNRLREKGFIRRSLRASLRAYPPARRRARELEAGVFGAPVAGVGERAAIALTGSPETLDRELELLEELGAKRVLARLYHHEGAREREARLAGVERLLESGYSVALALVQDRRAVRTPGDWDAFARDALRRVGERLRWVEVGHAFNRVKWGLWGYGDLAALLEPLVGWRRDFPHVSFTGPAGIDFEPARLAAALRLLPGGVEFDEISHHLYVDRRGAPEMPQGTYDGLRKLAFIRAVGESSGKCGAGLIVSEFNWPLLGTGVWSPVGSPYVSPGERFGDPSVDERRAAIYMVRYLLLGICSGLASEMVFWRLAAHGFGLVDDLDGVNWRKRPGFYALRHFYRNLNGSRFTGAENSAGFYDLRFETAAGRELRVVWHEPALGDADMPSLSPGKGRVTDCFGASAGRENMREIWGEGNLVYLFT